MFFPAVGRWINVCFSPKPCCCWCLCPLSPLWVWLACAGWETWLQSACQCINNSTVNALSNLLFKCFPLVLHSGSCWSHEFFRFSSCLHLFSALNLIGDVISLTSLPFLFNVFATCFGVMSRSRSSWSRNFFCLSLLVCHLVPISFRLPLGVRLVAWFPLFTCIPLYPIYSLLIAHSRAYIFLLVPPFSTIKLFPSLGPISRVISVVCLSFIFQLSPTYFPLLVWLVT